MKLIRSLAITGALAAGIVGPAFASLGGDAGSVQSDGLYMKSAVRVTPATGYAIHEMQSPGTTLREFVGADGKVFAVSWNGPGNPDLRQVLGTYYAHYEAGLAATPHSHRQVTISQADLVFQNSGRQRAFSGRAWVPAMLPQNFSVDDIK
jgi:Protein of unknown function (DUF2844)